MESMKTESNLYLVRYKLNKIYPSIESHIHPLLRRDRVISSAEKFVNVWASSEDEARKKLQDFQSKKDTAEKRHEVVIVDIEETIE